MPLYTASFSAVAVSAAQDLFEIVAPAGSSNILIREIRLGQYSDFGDAAAELLSILVIRGNTVTGSGGSAVTPVNLQSFSLASGATCAVNNTTIASGGSPVTVLADTWNVSAGWYWGPILRDQYINLIGGQRLVVRVTLPVDALTMNGSILFEEGAQ